MAEEVEEIKFQEEKEGENIPEFVAKEKQDLTDKEFPETFYLIVVDMDQITFDGPVKSLIAPGPDGNFAVLPGHTPLFAKIDPGKLLIEHKDGTDEKQIKGGIAKINQFQVTILVDF
ncbi:hypothetical protein COZ22_02460 [bacterium (Candidatus Howlettbacteria) CG_4_10_14_3_um_filter_37_10]|nr:MAG: hypothetical protein COX25_02720 [bacterium (Candidatus Howlettbacteria) CG23_combo_of_CG06-09_8_20_14_all_37_9]PIX99466.1 MAG: hypothetical protein COZ22_02460 [bacterium (Candidatus Howlettbacteria) CG_4_10_14_3_um_filter_37_10]PJB07339.1 MAG: hypothetical protein CO123_00300 [bacterium (Candidatus Howlettbacteria) CG_4_9_14_3_um_filter_37_10]